MTRSRLRSRPDGFILIVVLGAVLVLSSLLFGFTQRARTRLDAADGFHRMEQTWAGAWAGVQVAVAAVRDVNDARTDRQSERPLATDFTFSIDDTTCCVTMTEESGLLNVNRLKDPNDRLDRKHIDRFLRLIDLVNAQQDSSERIGYGLVPSLIDWIDPDDEVTHLPFIQRENTGAESSHYEAQFPPCSCRNRPLDTLDDLLSVKGAGPEAIRRLRPYLTCVGDGRININTAPKLVIQSLSERIDAALAQVILDRRERKPFDNVARLRDLPGMTDNVYRDIKDAITVQATDRFYRVTSQASGSNRTCTMEALLRRNTQAGTVDMISYRER